MASGDMAEEWQPKGPLAVNPTYVYGDLPVYPWADAAPTESPRIMYAEHAGSTRTFQPVRVRAPKAQIALQELSRKVVSKARVVKEVAVLIGAVVAAPKSSDEMNEDNYYEPGH